MVGWVGVRLALVGGRRRGGRGGGNWRSWDTLPAFQAGSCMPARPSRAHSQTPLPRLSQLLLPLPATFSLSPHPSTDRPYFISNTLNKDFIPASSIIPPSITILHIKACPTSQKCHPPMKRETTPGSLFKLCSSSILYIPLLTTNPYTSHNSVIQKPLTISQFRNPLTNLFTSDQPLARLSNASLFCSTPWPRGSTGSSSPNQVTSSSPGRQPIIVIVIIVIIIIVIIVVIIVWNFYNSSMMIMLTLMVASQLIIL